MAEELLTTSIAAPGFYGLNLQESSVSLSSGFALKAQNCVIDKSGRIASRKGWRPVNSVSAELGSNPIESIFELISIGNPVYIAAGNNKLFLGTENLTREYIRSASFVTGTYSQTTNVITVTRTSHGLTVATRIYLSFTTGASVNGYYVVASVPTANTFTVTAVDSKSASGAVTINTLAPTTIIRNDWQIAALSYGDANNFNAHAYLAQRGHPLLTYHELTTAGGGFSDHSSGISGFQRVGDAALLPDNHTVDTFQPDCVLSAYGRIWVGNIETDSQTVYFSDLLDGTNFKTGSAGYLNLQEVFPNGDPIVGLAAHNGFLIIFGKNNVAIYENPLDTSSLRLVEVIYNVGCIARDSIQNLGTDIFFLSNAGIRSLQRIIQEKSLPLRDISKNVRDELMANVGLELDYSKIKSTYYPKEAFYLLSLPANKTVYCFDTRAFLQDGAARVTVWDKIEPKSFCVTQSQSLLLGKDGYIGRYTGYDDNEIAYRLEYFTNYFDFSEPTKLKILKKLGFVLIGGLNQSVILKWGFDYSNNYQATPYIIENGVLYEYNNSTTDTIEGSTEYNIAEYTAGTAIDRFRINASGAGTLVQIGVETDINGSELSVQKIDCYIKQGKTV